MVIPPSILADMFCHAREEAPRECCGLLVGTGDAVVRHVRARNAEPGATRYLIDPQDHFHAIRQARADGLDVIGAYHSHPATAPVPSATDIAEAANGAGFFHVIVSPLNAEARAYRIDAGEWESVELKVAAG